ncbi:MAG: FHA domain-containing protein [Thermoleophilia bacterium]
MLEPILFGSKILFLVLLYLFIFMIVRRLARDLNRGEEPIGMPAKPVAPVAVPRASRASPVPGVAAPAPVASPPQAAPPVSAAGPVAPPVKPVTPTPGKDARKDRERMPEVPEAAPTTDSSTREFDYLVTRLVPRLVVQRSKFLEDGKVFELKGGATIGRSPRSQIVLPDDYVSSTHARIFARKQFLFLEDLGSTNGTFIDGRRIEGEHQIKPGQEIVIGDTIFRYEE